jgi:hypothetical protein
MRGRRTKLSANWMRRDQDDDDSLPVMVPRCDKALVPMSPTRVRRLREHLIKELGELRRRSIWTVSPLPSGGQVSSSS